MSPRIYHTLSSKFNLITPDFFAISSSALSTFHESKRKALLAAIERRKNKIKVILVDKQNGKIPT